MSLFCYTLLPNGSIDFYHEDKYMYVEPTTADRRNKNTDPNDKIEDVCVVVCAECLNEFVTNERRDQTNISYKEY